MPTPYMPSHTPRMPPYSSLWCRWILLGSIDLGCTQVVGHFLPPPSYLPRIMTSLLLGTLAYELYTQLDPARLRAY